MTNLPAPWPTDRLDRRWMGIAPMFRVWQSGGFDLGTPGLTDHDRFVL